MVMRPEWTLLDVLAHRARIHPSKPLFTFVKNGTEIVTHFTYGRFHARVRELAATLDARNARGERVFLLLESDLSFLEGFCGVTAAGGVAVPVPFPQSAKHVGHLVRIARDCAPTLAVTTRKLRDRYLPLVAGVPALSSIQLVCIDEERAAADVDVAPPRVEEFAFLQYTSGSTGNPKGVMVSHANLMANSEMIRKGMDWSEDEIVVCWLPLYHDMGLIGLALQSLYSGAHCYVMEPRSVIRPFRWLQAVTDFKATASAGPNFSFELATRNITEEERKRLDFSRLKAWVCGAEPISAETLRRFTARFAEQGARFDQFMACYGLAEATLCVTLSAHHAKKETLRVDRAAKVAGRIEPARDAGAAVTLVNCGKPPLDGVVTVIDPETARELPANGIGEILVKGPHVTRGYWGKDPAGLFLPEVGGEPGPFLRTGDLGFKNRKGELFVTGRLKDLIIHRGRNLSAVDVERAALSADDRLTPFGCAAFSIDEGGADERLIIVQETPWGLTGSALALIRQTVREKVLEECEIPVSVWYIVAPGGIPRTTSGKIRRLETKERYLKGKLDPYSLVDAYLPGVQKLRKYLRLTRKPSKRPSI